MTDAEPPRRHPAGDEATPAPAAPPPRLRSLADRRAARSNPPPQQTTPPEQLRSVAERRATRTGATPAPPTDPPAAPATPAPAAELTQAPQLPETSTPPPELPPADPDVDDKGSNAQQAPPVEPAAGPAEPALVDEPLEDTAEERTADEPVSLPAWAAAEAQPQRAIDEPPPTAPIAVAETPTDTDVLADEQEAPADVGPARPIVSDRPSPEPEIDEPAPDVAASSPAAPTDQAELPHADLLPVSELGEPALDAHLGERGAGEPLARPASLATTPETHTAEDRASPPATVIDNPSPVETPHIERQLDISADAQPTPGTQPALDPSASTPAPPLQPPYGPDDARRAHPRRARHTALIALVGVVVLLLGGVGGFALSSATADDVVNVEPAEPSATTTSTTQPTTSTAMPTTTRPTTTTTIRSRATTTPPPVAGENVPRDIIDADSLTIWLANQLNRPDLKRGALEGDIRFLQGNGTAMFETTTGACLAVDYIGWPSNPVPRLPLAAHPARCAQAFARNASTIVTF